MSKVLNILIAAFVLTSLVSSMAVADPLPGRDILKFQQVPMTMTPVDGMLYYGHDERSTLYNNDPANPLYTGLAMADDFADEFNTPVVHVRWWGSYLQNDIGTVIPKFLIAFESDTPADPGDPNSFSHPDQVLLSQVVIAGPLDPASGTFTEKLIFSAPPGSGADDVYEYNAELALEFNQLPDTVYWLKIAALLDFGDMTRWGWHNRDYTITNPLASPAVLPGEYIEGVTLGGTDVWHFQDDAVSAQTSYGINADGTWSLNQDAYIPQHYVDGVDGPIPDPNGIGGIGQFSKDLAFELYTTPEPATLAVLALGAIAGLIRRRK